MRLLIADDDANTINLLRQYLTRWNYEVVTASDGIEALKIIKGINPPQIIILDWLMPGMDGVEVIRQARQLEFPIPPYIILFTVRDEKGAIIEGLDAGANDYVTKPFNKDEFHARIRVGERFVPPAKLACGENQRAPGGDCSNSHPQGYHPHLFLLP